jgi:hypothetical protein
MRSNIADEKKTAENKRGDIEPAVDINFSFSDGQERADEQYAAAPVKTGIQQW